MGIFDGYLFCSDCDGTMTDQKGVLQKEDADAIRYFQKEGGRFTFATGRFPKYIDKFLVDFTPNAYQVMGNGTTVYDVDNRRVVHEVTMEPPKEALEFIINEGMCDLIFVDHLNESQGWCRQGTVERWGEKIEMPSDINELYKVDPEGWHKINFCFNTPEETIRAREIMAEKFPEYEFVCSWATGMELLPKDGGKGNAVRWLKKELGDQITRVICAGDYENDISLFEAADIGYAVENASELTKKAAHRVTVKNTEHAIREIMRDLVRDLGLEIPEELQ